MECAEIQNWIPLYLNGDIEDADFVNDIEHHIAECSECSSVFERMMSIRATYVNNPDIISHVKDGKNEESADDIANVVYNDEDHKTLLKDLAEKANSFRSHLHTLLQSIENHQNSWANAADIRSQITSCKKSVNDLETSVHNAKRTQQLTPKNLDDAAAVCRELIQQLDEFSNIIDEVEKTAKKEDQTAVDGDTPKELRTAEITNKFYNTVIVPVKDDMAPKFKQVYNEIDTEEETLQHIQDELAHAFNM